MLPRNEIEVTYINDLVNIAVAQSALCSLVLGLIACDVLEISAVLRYTSLTCYWKPPVYLTPCIADIDSYLLSFLFLFVYFMYLKTMKLGEKNGGVEIAHFLLKCLQWPQLGQLEARGKKPNLSPRVARAPGLELSPPATS